MNPISGTTYVQEMLYALPPQKTVAFAGAHVVHQQEYKHLAPEEKALLERLKCTIEAMILNGTTHFITGALLGTDLWAARIILKLKETYPHTQLHVYVPCVNHTDGWAQPSKDAYQRILQNADSVHYLSKDACNIHHRATLHATLIRDTSTIIAICDDTDYRTNIFVQEAHKEGRPVIRLHPVEKAIDLNL